MSVRDALKIVNIQETTSGAIHTIDKSDFYEGHFVAQDLSYGEIWLLNQLKKAISSEHEINIFYGYKS